MLPSVQVALERKLEHARDGARRIENTANERDMRIIATNIALTCVEALRLLRER